MSVRKGNDREADAPEFSAEFRRAAVQMAIGSDESIAAVARQLGMNEGTLTNWVNTYRKDHPQEDAPLTVSERARLRELERENRELRMKSEFWQKPRPSLPASISDLQIRVH
jgi:transposase